MDARVTPDSLPSDAQLIENERYAKALGIGVLCVEVDRLEKNLAETTVFLSREVDAHLDSIMHWNSQRADALDFVQTLRDSAPQTKAVQSLVKEIVRFFEELYEDKRASCG